VVEIRVLGPTFFQLDDVRSPDMGGDGLISLLDLVDWQLAFVGQGPIYMGDLDCDSFIALSDLVVWREHFVAP
jgi:hypothetical protein